MTLSFLTPWAALVGLLALAALAALVTAERRSRALCRSLGLRTRSRLAPVLPAAALAAVGGLLALAAAQPVVATVHRGEARTDAEVLFVFDISRSMLARSGSGGLTRFDRARRLAKDLHAQVGGDVPIGIATLTDRVLPHLFPTSSADVFVSTLDRSVGIERPPPDRTGRGRATSLGALAALGSRNFFRPGATKRVAVVFTDGESVPVRIAPLESDLAAGGVTPVFVRLWSADEQIFDAEGRPVDEYFADPDSVAVLDSVGNAIGGRVFAEGDTGAVAGEVRRAIGEGRTGPAGRELRSVELAPYSVAAAFLPLLLLVWRRNL